MVRHIQPRPARLQLQTRYNPTDVVGRGTLNHWLFPYLRLVFAYGQFVVPSRRAAAAAPGRERTSAHDR